MSTCLALTKTIDREGTAPDQVWVPLLGQAELEKRANRSF